MPTSTFFNLPPPKREKLFRAAVAEFARQPYGEVSLSQIIKAAEIPRGSFYQYFTDKTDLFHYVIGYYGENLERLVLESLEACGGQLLEMPLTIFDRMEAFFQTENWEFQMFLGVVRENVPLDMGGMWDFKVLLAAVIERADWSSLNIHNLEEQAALLDLLLPATAHALVSITCGKVSTADCRRHLKNKVALIRRGVER